MPTRIEVVNRQSDFFRQGRTEYVIELKIWRGNAYNERGEEQLCRYLEYFDLQQGYLLSFCFNKTKTSGLLPPVELNGRILIEAIV